ncbi:MAG: BRO family protein [bacterium]
MTQELTTKIAIFQKKGVRKIIHNNEWWFSIIDVIEALTGTERPRKYWNDLKTKLIKEGYSEVSENIGQLEIIAQDGKKRETDCANTETVFRIIQYRALSGKGNPKIITLGAILNGLGFRLSIESNARHSTIASFR